MPDFEACAAFAGARPGMVFKDGAKGLGYYRDAGSSGDPLSAGQEVMRADLAAVTAGTEAAMAPDDADAPIVAALASHGRALAEAEKEAATLEKEAGYNARGVVHPAQVIEVRLTDQLLQLNEMRDDCVTPAGRTAVKAVIGRLQALGDRLLRLSRRG